MGEPVEGARKSTARNLDVDRLELNRGPRLCPEVG